MTPEAPNPEDIPAIRSALLSYYDRQARDLPWRRDRDPYRILVSEIMLQQTRVETVLGYYDPWLERFPDVAALADADEDEVLKAWEGLGYYRRARNLHRAARMIREGAEGDRGSEGPGAEKGSDDAVPGMPTTYDGLRELPGVGEYTAGAVASIAFREVVPAVDGNVRRVLARLHDEPDPKPRWLRERAAALVHPERPGDWNQALMELGATVCTPRRPKCRRCPVAEWCAARRAGTQLERPTPRRKREVASVELVVAVVTDGRRILVRKRSPDGLLGGMWGLPERELDVEGVEAVVSTLLEETVPGLAPMPEAMTDELLRLEPVSHRFTHLSATYLPVVVALEEPPAVADDEVRWIDPEDDESTALPTAYRKVVDAWRSSRTVEKP